MKKIVVIVTVLALSVAGLAACGTGEKQGGSGADQNNSAAAPGQVFSPSGGLALQDAEEYYQRLLSCRDQIREITDFEPDIAIVLGSGMGDYAENGNIVETIPYSSIEGWPTTTVRDHKGNLVFAEYKGLKLAIMQGRVHYYEGYSMDEVVLPLRVLHLLGADTVILTNAVGAINTDYKVGDFVCVNDHISSFVPGPLVGENLDELGNRFPGMTNIYDEEMMQMVLETGAENGITVHTGVFLQVVGPHFESPAEIRMFRALGADTVGMSTAVESIAAAHMGMKICNINNVTNMAAGVEEEFTADSINESAADSAENFYILMAGLLTKIAENR